MTNTTINGLSTALAATAAADDLLVLWDTSAAATKKHAAAYLARSDGAAGNKLITGSGRELTVTATGTAALVSSGSWTPGISFGDATTGITYTAQTGSYYRIGGVVFLSGRINLSNKGSASGNLKITGLPVVPLSSIAYQSFSVGYGDNFSGLTASDWLAGLFLANANYALLYRIPLNGAAALLTASNFTNTTHIIINAMYVVA